MKSTVSNVGQGEYRTKVSGPYFKIDLYNDAGDVVLSQWLEQPLHLDNSTQELDCMPFQQGVEGMATKINRTIMIGGVKRWIHANTEQEYADKLMKLLDSKPPETGKHPFNEYAWNWFEVYSKPNIETVTATTYRRQLTRYLLPAFEGIAVEDITTDEVQRLFNSMDTAKATKEKVKIVLNQILEAAKDDNLIANNPFTTYRRQLTRYLLPAFEGIAVEDITTDEVQRLFNSMDTAKATKEKVKIVLNQILEAAKDDNLIANNPLKSKRLRITGLASKATQPYSVEQMRYLCPAYPRYSKSR